MVKKSWVSCLAAAFAAFVLSSCQGENQHAAAAAKADLQAVALGMLVLTHEPEYQAARNDMMANPELGVAMEIARLNSTAPQLEAEVREIYDEVFTPAELAAIRRFHSTRAGRSISEKYAELYAALSFTGASHMRAAAGIEPQFGISPDRSAN